MQFSPNPLVAQRSGGGPSNAGWENGNPAASDTSLAGLATVLWVGGRQAAGLAAGGGPRERGGEFASSSSWVCRWEGECLVLGSLDPACLESVGQGFAEAMLWDSPPASYPQKHPSSAFKQGINRKATRAWHCHCERCDLGLIASPLCLSFLLCKRKGLYEMIRKVTAGFKGLRGG